MAKVTLNVPDISCEHCERTILKTLQSQPGINAVRVDVPSKQVQVDYDEQAISLEKVDEVLEEEGYPVASKQPA